jgi:predicted AlkP superfamily phosphohydrolase/phosphomutase
MDTKPWDFFVIVFTGTDRLGHYLWPYHRSASVDDPPEVQALCNAVRDYYTCLDQIVGNLAKKAGRQVNTIIMSDHGMGPRDSRLIHLSSWLLQNGWLSVKTSGSKVTALDDWIRRLGLTRDQVKRLISWVPGLARSRAVKSAAARHGARIDQARSKAYGIRLAGSNNITGIRINPEVEAKESLRQAIMDGLAMIVDPETGKTPLQWVRRGEDCYHGPYAKNVPDILAAADPDYTWGYYPGRYSSVVMGRDIVSRRGYHRPEGVFMARGPGAVSNPRPLANVGIEDLAPTILYLMGLPIPSDLDGRVLTEILRPGILESQPVSKGTPLGFWPDQNAPLFDDESNDGEDDEQVRARLRALGYLG